MSADQTPITANQEGQRLTFDECVSFIEQAFGDRLVDEDISGLKELADIYGVPNIVGMVYKLQGEAADFAEESRLGVEYFLSDFKRDFAEEDSIPEYLGKWLDSDDARDQSS